MSQILNNTNNNAANNSRKNSQDADYFMKICVVGGGGVGKSALSIMCVKNIFCDEYDPTIEDSYRKQTVVDNEACLMELLDTAGQDDYSALREQVFRQGHGFVVVYSVTSQSSFEEIESFLNSIERSKDLDDSLKFIPVILVGNKCDLEEERQVTKNEGAQLAQRISSRLNCDCVFMESSARLNINACEVFHECVRQIRKARGQEQLLKPPQKEKRRNIMARLFSKIHAFF